MRTSARRVLGACATLAAVATLGLSAAGPAAAGGPGTVYIYGSTQSACEANLSASIHSQQRYHEISGVHHCRKTGDGQRWFGDYVMN